MSGTHLKVHRRDWGSLLGNVVKVGVQRGRRRGGRGRRDGLGRRHRRRHAVWLVGEDGGCQGRRLVHGHRLTSLRQVGRNKASHVLLELVGVAQSRGSNRKLQPQHKFRLRLAKRLTHSLPYPHSPSGQDGLS